MLIFLPAFSPLVFVQALSINLFQLSILFHFTFYHLVALPSYQPLATKVVSIAATTWTRPPPPPLSLLPPPTSFGAIPFVYQLQPQHR